jgi:hypothetical protein
MKSDGIPTSLRRTWQFHSIRVWLDRPCKPYVASLGACACFCSVRVCMCACTCVR